MAQKPIGQPVCAKNSIQPYTYSTSIRLRKEPVIFANPAGELISIAVGGEQVQGIVIFDANGSIVRRSSETQIFIADLPNGVYMLHIFTDSSAYKQQWIKL